MKELQVLSLRPHYAIVMPDRPNISVNGKIMETHVSNEDFYFDHNSHDSNFKVLLNDQFQNLNSQSNSKLAGKLLMEMEWEIGTANDGRTDRFPKEFWPFDGDFVSAEGRYIFDCGHVTDGPLTEIHPPSAVAFTRFEPMIFKFGGTDPLLASQSSIFINGAGGVFVPDINKLNNPDLNLLNAVTKLALSKQQQAEAAVLKEYQQRASGGEIIFDVKKVHEFNIPLPAQPFPSSFLITRVDTPFGGPVPKIEGPLRSADGTSFIKVSIDLSSQTKYGAHVAAGWVNPLQPNTYHHLRIEVQSLEKGDSIKQREGLNQPGSLLKADHYSFQNLWLGVNGQYKELLGPTAGAFGFRTATKKFDPPLTYDVIIAEQGVGSKLNIKSNWLYPIQRR